MTSLTDHMLDLYEHIRGAAPDCSPDAVLDAAQKIAVSEYIQKNKRGGGSWSGGGSSVPSAPPGPPPSGQCVDCGAPTGVVSEGPRAGQPFKRCYPCGQKHKQAQQAPPRQYYPDEEPF